MAEYEVAGLSARGGSNVAAIMPKIGAAVSERSKGTKIDLASAENWLMRPELLEICKESIYRDLETIHLSYPRAFAGFPEVLSAFTSFLNNYFAPIIPVEESHLATAPGAASCIDALLYNICDPGDGVLVPGPYWNGFDFQFKARSSVTPIVVSVGALGSTLTDALTPALEQAFDSSTCPVRGLLMSNPHNPLGQCYPRSVIEECMKFCQRRDIHYISDEVYALTNFPCPEIPFPVQFISALSIDVSKIGVELSRVHTVWSTSKDFGQSGVRMGCTITQGNREMAVGVTLASHTTTSTLSSVFVSALLRSPKLPALLETNSQRLLTGYTTLTGLLKKHSIDYIPCYAGLFLYARIAPKHDTWEEEKRMVEKVKNSGVLISAGRSFHGPEDERGWARIGFAVPEEQLEKAVVILDGVFENEKENAGIVGDSLTQLIGSLESVLNVLKRDGQSQLLDALHDPENLPDARLSRIANHAIDLLHETEQLLEPGSLVLADHFLGYVNSKCLCAAVELNIPDLLKSGPKKLYDLAKESKAQPKRLRQVLRVLHNNGIFSYEGTSDSYSINSTSALLVSDHWTQWRNWVDLYGNEFYDMARGIPESCKEGNERTAAQINFDTDTDMFTYFTERGWLPRLHKTLGGGAVAQAPGILEDYPWEEVADRRLLDVGGGGGALVASLLRKHKNMRGGILDIPSVIEHARQNFHGVEGEFADVGNRVDQSDLIVGDFLTAVPSFEVYTMKWCLHDWDDLKALRVMKNIRSGIVRCQQSRLIILESLLTDGRMGRLSRYGDLIMMISANGQERTETQWTALAQRTGWLINKIYHLRNSWPCAIELFPIWDDDRFVTKTSSSAAVASTDPDSQVNKNCYTESMEIASEASGSIGNLVPHQDFELSPNGIQSSPTPAKHPRATMSFLEPWDAGKGAPFFRSSPDEGFEGTNFKWEEKTVTVRNARDQIEQFTLDKNGFCFVNDDELSLELIHALRVGKKEVVRELYYPKVERLMKTLTGASRVIIFDHTVRKRDPSMNKEDNPNGKEQPATVVHCDQSAKGALRRVKQNISENDDINEIVDAGVQMINVWRPLIGPIVDWPLAMMDYRSLSSSDVHPCDLWRHQFEEKGQTVTFTHNENQKWYYLDRHRTNEVSLIKIWDSRREGIANMCAHVAFEHPDTPCDTTPRESVEVRCIVVK